MKLEEVGAKNLPQEKTLHVTIPENLDYETVFEEFMEQYKVVDTDGIYMSKGAELVPIFRMRQWFEHLPSAQPTQSNTPNTLNALDLIDREAAIEEIARRDTTDGTVKVFSGKEVISILKEMP